jgi:hypothetical protein
MCENPECPKAGDCNGECARLIFVWAKKARTELELHQIDTDYSDEYAEDFNNEDVISLCNEYDNLFI